MADDTQAPDAPAAADAPAPAAEGNAPDTNEPTDAPAEHDEPISLEAARKLRSENRNLRDRLKEFEDANKSEFQRLQESLESIKVERDAALTELRQLRAQAALAEAGALHPELLTTRLPDDAYEDANAMAQAVATLRQSYPSLFRAPNGSADGAASGGSTEARDINALIRQLAKEAT